MDLAQVDPARWKGRLRAGCLVVAAVILVALFVPPLSLEVGRSEVAETVQFALAALVVPPLIVLGAPWRTLGLAPGGGAATGGRPFGRWAAVRERHPELIRALAFLVVDVAVLVVWRTPAAVDALAAHGWLAAVEVVSVVVAGCGLWLELVDSPPLAPRVPRPWRAVLAALALWAVWIVAYLLGLSHAAWYPAYHHRPGVGLSVAAEQQLSTGILWLAAACAFVPLVFTDVLEWLRREDDPDTELRRLLRAERHAGGTSGGSGA